MAKTILLIEADEAFAAQLTNGLEQRGASVKHTADGKEGLRIATEEQVDAIILCVELPRMSGYAVCNKLKKADELKGIPLIITSSEATPKTFDQHKKLKTRAEEYVIKPCDPSEVVEKVHGLVGLEEGESTVSTEVDDDLELLEDAFDALEMDEGGDEGTQLVDREELADVTLEPLEVSDSQVEEVDTSDISIETLGDDLEDLEDPGLDFDDGTSGLESAEAAVDALGGMDEPALSTPEEGRPAPKRPGDAAAAHRLSALEEETARLRRERGELETRISSLEDDLRARTNELEAFKASGATASAGAKDALRLKGELTQRDKEILALKEAVNEKEKAVLEGQERENQLELKAAELEETALTHEAQIKTLNEKVASQDERIEKLHGELDEANAQARRVGEFEAELSAAAEERNGLEGRIADLGERLAEAQGKGAALEGELATVRSELNTSRGDADSLRSELSTTRRDLESARSERDSVRSELTVVRKEAQRAKELDERVALLEEQVRTLDSENNKNETRAVKAYQRLKADEKVREKTRKALEVALELLEESPGELLDLDASLDGSDDDDGLESLKIESA